MAHMRTPEEEPQTRQNGKLPFDEYRYRHLRRLGEGAQGAVYLVEDRFLGGKKLAIKLLRPQGTGEWRQAFRHEFEVLAGLRHPRLSEVHDFGATSDGRIFFTRDFVTGKDLRAATNGMSPTALLALVVEICRALKPLHQRGLVHGDLKPGNIIQAPDGVAHLIDFSFVRACGQDAMRRGTVQYMAPEIIKGRSADARADLYALGATIFDIVSGDPPFTGSSSEVVAGHLGKNRPVLKPERIEPTTPKESRILEGLSGITERLLAPKPDHRFPDILELEASLLALAEDGGPDDPLPDHPVVDFSLGRDKELGRVQQAVSDAIKADVEAAPLWVIEGALGTGKSAFLREIKWWAQLNGMLVVETSCRGGGLLRPIVAILDQVTQGAAGDLCDLLAHPQSAGIDLDAMTLKFSELVLGKAVDHQLLVLIDDAEQASPEALKMLRGLTAAVRPSHRVAILATIEAGVSWAEQLGQGAQVVLPVLGPEQVSSLVVSFLGRADDEAVERVLAHTGGNPLFVTTLLKDLATADQGLAGLEHLGPPGPLEAYWRERLSSLEGEQRRLLEAAAVLERPSSPAELAQVADIDPHLASAQLTALEAGGWMRHGPAGWHVTTKPLGREVLFSATEERRVASHRRARKIVPDEAKQVLHAARGQEVAIVKAQGRQTAQALTRLGALHAARELLEAMGEVLHGEPEAPAVALDLGRTCLAIGDYPEAKAYLLPLTQQTDRELRRSALLLLGRLYNLRRDLDESAACLNKALEIGENPADESRALRELANVEFKRNQLAACQASAVEGLSRAQPADPVRADLLGILAKASAQAGNHDTALAQAKKAVTEARAAGDRRSIALALGVQAWVHQVTGDLGGAVEELEKAIELNRTIGDLPRLMRDQLVLSDLKMWLERWPEALVSYEETARLARAVANPVQGLQVRASLALALVKVGRFERAQLLLDEVETEAQAFHLDEQRFWALEFKGDLWGAQGDVDSAITCYQQALEGFERLGRQAIAAEVELYQAGWLLWRNGPGDVARARALIDNACRREREDVGRDFDAKLLLERGALAMARGQFEQGMASLEQLTDKQGEGLRDLTWQAQLVAARAYIERDNEFQGRRCLRDAEKQLERLSAGFQTADRWAFWQDVRRTEVRQLLDQLASSSMPSSTLSAHLQQPLDAEAKALYQVLEFNKRLLVDDDLSHLLEAILDAVIDLTGAERGLVLLAGEQRLEVHAARDMGKSKVLDAFKRFSQSIAESVHLDGEPVVTVDAMGDQRFNEFLSIHELQLKSVACFPLRFRGRSLGVLYLDHRFQKGKFEGKDFRVLNAFADQVAIAISQARLIEEARTREAELTRMHQALETTLASKLADLEAKDVDLSITKRRLERMQEQLKTDQDFHGVIGSGSAMQQVFSMIERVKNLDVPVVFVGKSGTGKDLLARVLHDIGERQDGPFVSLNCGGIPETLIESTLFGHRRGSFSGAAEDRQGVLGAAAGGTLYLDDIGEMSPRMQVILLRVLQENSYTPLGDVRQVEARFRLIASSRFPLETLEAEGRLRRDLLYRLQVVVIDLPELNERVEDIPLLAARILKRECATMNKSNPGFSKEALEALITTSWPGNVRQLEQSIRRAVIIHDGSEPMAASSFTDQALTVRPPSTPPRPGAGPSLPQSVRSEKERIAEALEKCMWNRTMAAKELGIPRRTFYRKLKKYKLIP